MKQTKDVTIPCGYGGNMDYTNVKLGSTPLPMKEGFEANIVVVGNTNGLTFHFEYSENLEEKVDMQKAVVQFQLLDLSQILQHRGTYFKN